MELTILIPCLNEEETIAICIEKAKEFLKINKIDGEVLIADNGSSDKSVEISKKLGARVIHVSERGYGAALIAGTKQAKGKYTIMGDADDSYNFLEIKPFVEMLYKGYDLVVGNRYRGKIQKRAMKFWHRYLGTPLISLLGRKKYKIPVKDFNCGLRGYKTEKIRNLEYRTTGMEYATEMLIKSKKAGLRIIEIPINFYKDKRKKASHLNTIKDGIKHIKVIIGQ